MSDASSLPPALPSKDAEQLRLLSIFHYVGAGLAVVGLAFLFAHYSFMSFFFANPKMWEGQKGGPPPVEIFALFKWFYLIVAAFLIAFGIVNLLSGRFIARRTHRTFSLVVAGLNCVHVPLGVGLGVFTFIVLGRDSVREIYRS